MLLRRPIIVQSMPAIAPPLLTAYSVCAHHVSFLSRINPRYFIRCPHGMISFSNSILRRSSMWWWREKIIAAHLPGFISILHCVVQLLQIGLKSLVNDLFFSVAGRNQGIVNKLCYFHCWVRWNIRHVYDKGLEKALHLPQHQSVLVLVDDLVFLFRKIQSYGARDDFHVHHLVYETIPPDSIKSFIDV